MNLTGVGIDDPDVNFYENYYSTSDRNYSRYKNPEVDKLIEQQSAEVDRDKRKQLVWKIEKILADDVARPIIGYNVANTCWDPKVKGLVLQVNSIYNGWRFDDVWLDK
jgi:peptide/nickel transport system substrate-binding protein